MKSNIVFLLAFLPILAFSQKNASIEIGSSLNFTDYSNKIAKTEGRLNYDFGMAMVLPTKNKNREWLIGLKLIAYGSKIVNDNLKWGIQNDGVGGYDPTKPTGEDITGITFKENNFYLELPVSVRQYLGNGKRTRFFFQAGAGPTVFLSNHNNMTLTNSDGISQNSILGEDTNNFRKINIAANLGFGLQLPISGKFQLQFMPQGQAQLFNIVENSNTGAKWYAFGLHGSLRYKLL